MLDLAASAWALGAIMTAAFSFWLVSLVRNDVSIVDVLWSLMFLLMLTVYLLLAGINSPRAWLVLMLVSTWALRLAVFIAHRNHGKPEDYRYREIRRNNEPNFRLKSLYIVFGLQAVLAGLIAVPLLVAASSPSPLGWLDLIGVILWAVGMFFEVLGDHQLARFRAVAANRGKVLDTGLWRLTRHPNYFGEFTIWWGYFFLALAGGGWWTVLSPLLMSYLLLKVSGVSLLERSIAQRRPEYVDYVRKTNVFFPWPRRW
jgi:steroid 5-alpha reductase family enzyme